MPWRIAILMGTDPGLPAMQQHDRALRATLQAAAPAGVTFFTDALDAYRFDYREFRDEFLAMQRKKYAGRPVDLVIGVGEFAIEAVIEQRDMLWPGVPIVLSGLDEATFVPGRMPAGTDYVTMRLDVQGTLSLIEALQPDARRLVIAGGAGKQDLYIAARVAASARERGRWQTETWNTLTIDQMRERLALLDPDVAVVFTTTSVDAAGPAPFSVDTLARLAAASRAPLYGLFGTYVGHGVTAGSMVDFEATGRRAAELAIARLQGGPSPQSHAAPAPARCIADYVALRAHGLDPSALPADCELLNPPRSLWTEYRSTVLAASALIALQGLTIGGLLVQRRRRLQAEVDANQRGIELARAMRFAAMGELTASIAHEINQPLGAILSNADAAEMMLRSGTATPDALREILADIRRDDVRASEVIRRLRALMEKHEVEHISMPLNAALREALALVEPEVRRRGVTLETALAAADDRLLGDAVQIQQVLINLVMNAMDAMHTTPAERKRVTVVTADLQDAVALTVSDRGIGVAPEMRERVFESFHTNKPHGMGLGLPIVRAIVHAHHGQITLAAREGGGTIFTVLLPRRRSVPATDLPAMAGGQP
jgi:signal transduction histidine kinase